MVQSQRLIERHHLLETKLFQELVEIVLWHHSSYWNTTRNKQFHKTIKAEVSVKKSIDKKNCLLKPVRKLVFLRDKDEPFPTTPIDILQSN